MVSHSILESCFGQCRWTKQITRCKFRHTELACCCQRERRLDSNEPLNRSSEQHQRRHQQWCLTSVLAAESRSLALRTCKFLHRFGVGKLCDRQRFWVQQRFLSWVGKRGCEAYQVSRHRVPYKFVFSICRLISPHISVLLYQKQILANGIPGTNSGMLFRGKCCNVGFSRSMGLGLFCMNKGGAFHACAGYHRESKYIEYGRQICEMKISLALAVLGKRKMILLWGVESRYVYVEAHVSYCKIQSRVKMRTPTQ